MNQTEYVAAIKKFKNAYSVDGAFLPRWFEETLRQLDSLAKQGGAIKHPRYRGDTRESDFSQILRRSLPPAVTLSRGFVSNEYGTLSREQDCLLLDSRNAAPLVCTDKASYFPYESVLASVEIKSKLTAAELRRMAVNCVSLRRLKKNLAADDKDKEAGKAAYFVFAYATSWSLEKTSRRLNDTLVDVPFDLRPSMVYILNKGFLLPKSDRGFGLDRDQLFAGAEFAPQGPMKASKNSAPTQALPFLWFLTNIIDHCTSELFGRKNYWLGRYIFAPLFTQQRVDEQV